MDIKYYIILLWYTCGVSSIALAITTLFARYAIARSFKNICYLPLSMRETSFTKLSRIEYVIGIVFFINSFIIAVVLLSTIRLLT